MNERRQELDERIADDERHSATMRKARDYDDLLARAEAAEALAYERLESAVFAEQRANDAEVERDELRDANSVLSDALETTRQTLVTLTARAAELQAALAAERAAHAWRPFHVNGDHPIGVPIEAIIVVEDDPDNLTWVFDVRFWRPAAPQEPTPATTE